MTSLTRGSLAAIDPVWALPARTPLHGSVHARPGPAKVVDGTPADDAYLAGTAQDDTLRGLGGDDALQGFEGNDRLDGGSGTDLAWYDDAVAAVTVDLTAGTATGGSGNDTLVSIEDVWGSSYGDTLLGSAGANELTGDAGNDSLQGRAGDDTLTGGLGDDTLDGGSGYDTADYTFAAAGVRVDLNTGRASGGDGSDRLISIEDVFGSFFDDTLTGNDFVNFLFGSYGNDTLDGGGGDDYAGFFATLAEAQISYDPATGVLTVSSEFDGTDRLRRVEQLIFGDETFEASLFTTAIAPLPLAFLPARESRDVSVNSDLVVVFNEPVQRGSGQLLLRDATGAVVMRFDAATSSALSIDGSRLTIDPTAQLARGMHYTLEIEAGALRDLQGNANASFGGYGFTTQALVEVRLPDEIKVAEGAGRVQFAVSLSEASDKAVQVTLTLEDLGTAAGVVDVSQLPLRLNFAVGQTQQLVTLALRDDALFEPTAGLRLSLVSATNAVLAPGGASAELLVTDDDGAGRALPDDPLAAQQWHLYPGIGVNVQSVWSEYTGAGVRVAVFDQGIDPAHADLATQLDTALGRRASDLTGNGDPRGSGDNHGTAVAGVIAAARNGVGGVGVAYGAELVSLYSSLSADSATREIENVFSHARQVDVLNNSWGYAPQYYLDAPWAFEDNFGTDEFRASGVALKLLAEQGRGGLGTVVVQSAGNSFEFGDDTNLHNFQNSRYIVTVAATDITGAAAHYSSPGASILVAAPGGGGEGENDFRDILTTDRSGSAGYDPGNQVRIAGTSFSAPIVSGVVALMLEANPQLGYRDVQRILAASARITDAAGNLWQYNGGHHWNGGGLHYDAEVHDLGFGLVDAHAAVRLAETWGRDASTSANDVEISDRNSVMVQIPDGRESVTQRLSFTQAIVVERAEVTIDIRHEYIGDLTLKLVSPSGTVSWLLSRPGQNEQSPFGNDQDNVIFTFDTVLSMGESSVGEWALTVYDNAERDIGLMRGWTLNLIGRPDTGDDVYLYTDEYAESVARAAARATLADAAGSDTVNAAAVTSDSVIDLVAGAAGRLDGQAFGIAAGSQIEHAIGGDGHDRLLGNALANTLQGWRGNDRLQGRGGDDTLEGGVGIDTAAYDGPRARYTLQAGAAGRWSVADTTGADGLDTLATVERLQFQDRAWALDTGSTGHAGQAAQILRALFGRSFLHDAGYVGIGIGLLDGGMAYADVVSLAIGSGVVAQVAGSASNRDFVTLVYRNLTGVSPDAATLAQYAGLLDNGTYTQASLGLLACQLDDNVMSADLVGLQTSGIEFVPVG